MTAQQIVLNTSKFHFVQVVSLCRLCVQMYYCAVRTLLRFKLHDYQCYHLSNMAPNDLISHAHSNLDFLCLNAQCCVQT